MHGPTNIKRAVVSFLPPPILHLLAYDRRQVCTLWDQRVACWRAKWRTAEVVLFKSFVMKSKAPEKDAEAKYKCVLSKGSLLSTQSCRWMQECTSEYRSSAFVTH